MAEFLSNAVAVPNSIRPATKVMTRYTPNSGSGMQDT